MREGLEVLPAQQSGTLAPEVHHHAFLHCFPSMHAASSETVPNPHPNCLFYDFVFN